MDQASDAIPLSQGMHYEDFFVGQRFKTPRRTIHEADLCAFVNVTHINEALFIDAVHALQESPIKGRVVPGALSYSFAEGLCVVELTQHTGIAFLQMDLKMENPAFIGDTIHVEIEITETRRSNSRPDRGLVRSLNRVLKEDGTTVLTYTPQRMIKCRSAA